MMSVVLHQGDSLFSLILAGGLVIRMRSDNVCIHNRAPLQGWSPLIHDDTLVSLFGQHTKYIRIRDMN